MDTIRTGWKYDQKLVTEFDGSDLSEEHKKTLVMFIMLGEHVEHMRGKFMEDKFKDDYFAFEQELYDRMAQKKMDDDNKKGTHAVTSSGQIEEQPDDKQDYTEIWSEEWQCYMCGLAVKKRTR